jgi:hypothetical protein
MYRARGKLRAALRRESMAISVADGKSKENRNMPAKEPLQSRMIVAPWTMPGQRVFSV